MECFPFFRDLWRMSKLGYHLSRGPRNVNTTSSLRKIGNIITQIKNMNFLLARIFFLFLILFNKNPRIICQHNWLREYEYQLLSFASYYNVLNIYRGNEERNINGTKIQLSFFCLGWKAQAGNEPTRVHIINKEQRSSAINIVNSPFLHNIATSLSDSPTLSLILPCTRELPRPGL